MAKKNGFNKAANAAIVSGIILMVFSIWAFFYVNGSSDLSRMIIEFRSEVFGVAVSVFLFGIVGKFIGVKLG